MSELGWRSSSQSNKSHDMQIMAQLIHSPSFQRPDFDVFEKIRPVGTKRIRQTCLIHLGSATSRRSPGHSRWQGALRAHPRRGVVQPAGLRGNAASQPCRCVCALAIQKNCKHCQLCRALPTSTTPPAPPPPVPPPRPPPPSSPPPP